MFHNLKPHGLQHPRLPYPLPSPEAYSNSCPLSQWCCLTISSFVVPFSCLPSFPASWSFPMSWLFTSGGQSIEALASVLPMNVQGWFPLDWLVWSPCYPRDSQKSLSSTTVWKHQFFGAQPSLWSNTHIHTWLLEKPLHCLYGPLSAKWCLRFLICCLGLPLIFFQGASVF